MKIIAVVNQKGGVGKTMLTDEIAYSLERSGIKTSVYDMDGQGGLSHAPISLDRMEDDDADVAVVDTPGALLAESADIIAAADVVVIPTRCSKRDIEPLETTRDAVLKNNSKAKVVYVFNCWNRFTAGSHFEEWFETLPGKKTVAKVCQGEAIAQAAEWDQSVVAYAPRSKAAADIKNACNVIRKAARIKEEV